MADNGFLYAEHIILYVCICSVTTLSLRQCSAVPWNKTNMQFVVSCSQIPTQETVQKRLLLVRHLSVTPNLRTLAELLAAEKPLQSRLYVLGSLLAKFAA